MARMINADALQELCNKRIKDTWNSKTAPVSWAEAYADFKDDINSIPAFAQPGNPLTLDQLREMQCEKVVLYRMKSTEPLETGTVKENGDVLGDAGTLAYHELYLETWVAFSVAPAQQRWIPVSERLPERRRRVLCRLSYPDIEEIIVENQYYGNGMWMEESEAVTHWMPLPEPPEEG